MHCHYAEWQVQRSYCECYNAVCIYTGVLCFQCVFLCTGVHVGMCLCVQVCCVLNVYSVCTGVLCFERVLCVYRCVVF